MGAFGSTALIYLASLQDISIELYEAAELDGASPRQRIRYIALPHLYPVMSVMFVLQVIAVVQVFTEPFLLTRGGPGRETLTPAMHIYNRAFIRIDMGMPRLERDDDRCPCGLLYRIPYHQQQDQRGIVSKQDRINMGSRLFFQYRTAHL